MYLYSNTSTHSISWLPVGGAWEQFEVCLEITFEWTHRYTPRPKLSKFGDTLEGSNNAALKAVVAWVWRLTWRVWSSEFGDTPGGGNWVNFEMHSEIVIERVRRCTWRPWWSKLAGHNRVCMEIHVEALIEQVWRWTWRPWSSEFGDTLGGCDWARLDNYLEAVDGRHARCWDSFHQLVNLQPDKVTIPLSSHGELADGRRLCRDARWELKLHLGVNR